MDRYILDTNLFFNMEAGLDFGQKTEEVIKNITEVGKKLKMEKKAELFMPPRAIDEFLSFFENKEQPFIEEFLSMVIVESPDVTKLNFSATLFYKLIEDVRLRNFRGMTIAEEEIKTAAEKLKDKKTENKKDFEMAIGPVIKNFRLRFRNATRSGFIDSLTDLDLIVLAKQKEGFLITTDEGVTSWGRSFGVKEMPVSAWKKRTEHLLAAPPLRE